jgi:diadenosine tetraphosphate (Ap4A) HIT family hydrolase
MEDFSEKNLIENCPHCDRNSLALEHPLTETDLFWVVCDIHPLIEGHVLIIPKKHLSCVGEYDQKTMAEFNKLYSIFSNFIRNKYGNVSSFEHGKIGQTVFHSHVHLLPFAGATKKIVPEGEKFLTKIKHISDLKSIFEKDQKYLFFSIEEQLWLVDVKLGAPRFFRDRFAQALEVANRGNWKEMRQNSVLLLQADHDITKTKANWQKYLTKKN